MILIAIKVKKCVSVSDKNHLILKRSTKVGFGFILSESARKNKSRDQNHQKFKSKIEKRRRLELDLLKIINFDLKKSRWGQEKGPKPSLLSPHPLYLNFRSRFRAFPSISKTS